MANEKNAPVKADSQNAKAPEPKTVANDMDTRRVFPTPDAAAEYLTAMGESLSDFGAITLAAPGIDSEGNFDPKVYSDQMDVMVSKLGGKTRGSVKAIVVAPVPKVNVLLGLDSEAWEALPEPSRDWVTRILHKEMNHVAVRNLRDAEDVSTMVDQMPTTIEGYISSTRADAGILEAYNELYKSIIATLSAYPVWAKARLTKAELRKAFESKGYAGEYYGGVENYEAKGIESGLFVVGLNLGIKAATRKGLDPTIFQRWLDTRDSKVFTPGQTDEDDEDEGFDLDAMVGSMLEADKSDEAETPADTDATKDDSTEPTPAAEEPATA